MSIAISPIREATFPLLADRAVRAAIPAAWTRRMTLLILALAPLGFGATSVRGGIILTACAWLVFLVGLAEALRAGRMELRAVHVTLPLAALLAFTAMHWAAGVSANPVASQAEWLRWVGIVALAFVAGEAFGTPAQLRRMCVALALAGVGIALFAIAQYVTSNGKIYWMVEPSQGGWIFGPYVNRNHFAGLMELWIPLALGLALMPENTFLRRWLWCVAAVVMGTAVALSGSRGGLIAVFIEVLVIAFAAAAWRGRRAVLGLGIAVACVAIAVVTLGRGEIFERYQQSIQLPKLQQEAAATHRLEAWRGSLEIFRQHPVLGAGLDTFGTHFPAVRRFATDKVWTHAHNDFLQFAAETGLLGIALAGWILVVGTREAWRNVQRTLGTATGALLIGIACACIGFLAHGWLDFNFHVPANAANFAVLGVVLARKGWDED